MTENRIMRAIVSVLLIVSTLTISSCTYSIKPDALPSAPDEFAMPYEELEEKYPDIQLLSRYFNSNKVDPEEIKKVWGEPDKVKKDWWYYPMMGASAGGLWLAGIGPGPIVIAFGLGFLIMPVSPRKYVWIKDNYCIEAYVGTGFPIYRSRIVRWIWTDLREVDDPGSNCILKESEDGDKE